VWSLALYQKEALKCIDDIQQRQKMPILVGGTGQYVQTVIEGWSLPPQEPNPALREVLSQWAAEIGAWALYCKLKIIDPEAAKHIEFQNIRRTVRALEVIFMTGKRFSEQRQKSGSPFSYLMIGLKRPRPELYERIDQRIDLMIKNGLMDETEKLLQAGYTSDLSTLSAIGYREMIACHEGKMNLDEAVVLMKRLTRQFVRRQANWFKESDPSVHWFDMEDGVIDKIEAFVRSGEGWVKPE
jgi:tRNA dimethylallyltransferase